MDKTFVLIVSLILGTLFAYLSIQIIGYGAAIAIPIYIMEPITKSLPYTGFAIIDLITSGLPLALVYIIFALLLKQLTLGKTSPPYFVLSLPFLATHIYFVAMSLKHSGFTLWLITSLPKYALVAICVFYFIKYQSSPYEKS